MTTLVHELAHAYCVLFFNYCPADGDIESVVEEDGGHGRLWRETNGSIISHLRSWHPSLAGLDKPEDSEVMVFFAEVYFGWAAKIKGLSRAWDATAGRGSDETEEMEMENLRVRGWKWRPGPRAELKRAMARMAHVSREHFVATRIPYPRDVLVWICPVALVFLMRFAYWCVALLEYLAGRFEEYVPDREMRELVITLLLQLFDLNVNQRCLISVRINSVSSVNCSSRY